MSNNYPYIKAWGKFLGSKPYYIEGQQDLARKESAPADAIFKRNNGEWATFGNLSSLTKQKVLEQKEAQNGL